MSNRKETFLEQLEYQWICPITSQTMQDPVLTVDGYTYQRKAIQKWLTNHQTSPKTNLPLASKTLIPNRVLKDLIKRFKWQDHSFLRTDERKRSITYNPQINDLKQQQKDKQNNKIIKKLEDKVKVLQQLVQELIVFIQKNIIKILPQSYYLKKIFSNQDLKQRYKSDANNSKFFYLGHYDTKIDMKQFIKYNWKCLSKIDLLNCEIDDEGWKVLVDRSQLFENVQKIWIYGNKIVNIKKGDLQKFKSLKEVYICSGKWKNPLSQKSRNELRQFQISHPNIHIQY